MQLAYTRPEHLVIEVNNWSPNPDLAYRHPTLDLNAQAIFVLQSMGLPSDTVMGIAKKVTPSDSRRMTAAGVRHN